MIIYNEEFSSYSELESEMNKKEEKRIKYIEKKLEILLFKNNYLKILLKC